MFGGVNNRFGGESSGSTPGGGSRSQPPKDQCNILLNVVYSGEKVSKSAPKNLKHERFRKKRKFLARKGLLKSNKTEPCIQKNVADLNRKAHSLIRALNIPALPPAVIMASKYVAIDCEMVGCGPQGQLSELARCSVVSYEGNVVFDEFIKPDMPVTCYRTRWSGIKPCNLIHAMPIQEAKKLVAKLLHGKVVVGHAVYNDFKSLAYEHPPSHTRDTQKIPLLNLKGGFDVQRVVSLKNMSKAILNHDIQTGKNGHSSLEDARATMKLYRVVATDWEKVLASGYNFWEALKKGTAQ